MSYRLMIRTNLGWTHWSTYKRAGFARRVAGQLHALDRCRVDEVLPGEPTGSVEIEAMYVDRYDEEAT